MKGPNKILLTVFTVAALSVASISMVSAYGGPGGPGGGCDRGSYSDGPRDKRGKDRDVDMEQRVADKLDWVKYKLHITEKQEPAWREFTDTIGKSVAAMRERRKQRNADTETKQTQTVTERVQQMRAGAEQMTQVAAAIEKMYNTLTPEQKKIADQINPRRMRRF